MIVQSLQMSAQHFPGPSSNFRLPGTELRQAVQALEKDGHRAAPRFLLGLARGHEGVPGSHERGLQQQGLPVSHDRLQPTVRIIVRRRIRLGRRGDGQELVLAIGHRYDGRSHLIFEGDTPQG